MPFFIFGTGRCGSTHLQRLISLQSTTWVWGEHEGFLIDILQGVHRFESSESLNETGFRNPHFADDQELMKRLLDGVGDIAWLNRFARNKLRQEVVLLIERMFIENLPVGRDDWGFKEIRYGWGNDVPRDLLEMFPSVTAAFTFRKPRDTIESMLATWSPKLLQDEVRSPELDAMFKRVAERWKSVMNYFLNLKQVESNRLKFLSTQEFGVESGALFEKLGLKKNTEIALQKPLGITNRGPKMANGWSSKIIDTNYEIICEEFEAIFAAASEIARIDISN